MDYMTKGDLALWENRRGYGYGGVDALIFKINLFYNTASAVRVWNDLQALQVIVFYNIGEGCRYLITKRGVKSLLLEFVIDFASLVFHCVGSAITNNAAVLCTQ